ncbi:DUF1697 domain-containing protein [Rhodococcus sp. P1Y]|uniref:DUF1697 domain-containing protein n=1 Tax=Rhodococcus sp. P1Y TaxID=1302308 RepID=UPI000EAE4497|nr:DUF1697 domain-containing protein [Rhodococcus sp. P1Y]AYJ48662.1 DUF1697 domain-containing protein [Rhodococcus sp. P1Y]
MTAYVLLLRGINVGGKNKIPMAELRGFLGDLGFEDVATYIQSGNALLTSDHGADAIRELVEDGLPTRFDLDSSIIKVLVLSAAQLRAVETNKPEGFGDEPDKYHSDAIFMMGIGVDEAMAVFNPREGVDAVWPGDGVIYSRRVTALRTKSRLSAIIESPLYKSMTIRSWSTTTKLLSRIDDIDAART